VIATLDNLAIMATVELFEANFAEFGEMYFSYLRHSGKA
jgi:hypothetical protein